VILAGAEVFKQSFAPEEMLRRTLQKMTGGEEATRRVMDLDDDDIAWVKAHALAVNETFGREFEAAKDRFREGQLLLDRFNAAIDLLLTRGRGHFRAVDEAHNEICITSALLANTRLRFIRLEYETPLPGCARTIDSGRQPIPGRSFMLT
jgi:hypothetical protein